MNKTDVYLMFWFFIWKGKRPLVLVTFDEMKRAKITCFVVAGTTLMCFSCHIRHLTKCPNWCRTWNICFLLIFSWKMLQPNFAFWDIFMLLRCLKWRILSQTSTEESGKNKKIWFFLLGFKYTLRKYFESKNFLPKSCPELSNQVLSFSEGQIY